MIQKMQKLTLAVSKILMFCIQIYVYVYMYRYICAYVYIYIHNTSSKDLLIYRLLIIYFV